MNRTNRIAKIGIALGLIVGIIPRLMALWSYRRWQEGPVAKPVAATIVVWNCIPVAAHRSASIRGACESSCCPEGSVGYRVTQTVTFSPNVPPNQDAGVSATDLCRLRLRPKRTGVCPVWSAGGFVEADCWNVMLLS
jgi:hypothetical protein